MNRNSTSYKVLTTAVALMVVFTLVTGVPHLDDNTSVQDTTGTQEAEAIAPILAYGTAAVIGGVIGGGAGYFLKGSDNFNETKAAELDAQETHTAIYDKAATLEGGDNIHNDALNNHLQDTQNTALLIGKNAYVRSLNRGDSQSQSEINAKEAVSDYYAEREIQLINRWNLGVSDFEAIYHAIANESELSYYDVFDHSEFNNSLEFKEYDYNLINGSTYTALEVNQSSGSNVLRMTGGDLYYGGTAEYGRVYIEPPSSDYDGVTILESYRYSDRVQDIKSQKNDVHTELETFIQNTYSEYQVGEIDNSDLIDPYMGNRKYSPEGDYQNWALRSLQQTGINTPQNLSDFGAMKIELEDGSVIEGILMSDGLPANNTFKQGVTYNTSNLKGTQYVIQNDGERELDGEFTILSVTDTSGETVEGPVEYRQPSYQTSSLDGYRQLMQELADYNADVNARQENTRDTSGGIGGILPSVDWFSFNRIPGGVVIIALLAGFFVLTRRG